ncbi:MAG: hypothetical protein QOI51_361 [Nocardioidaceae bacterium]|jgi:hypothetical protein|nr:hypothetical protein [Nocardioidaceae bacterium]MDX6307869.1 hypothetical protein [Nocardioidaceae bacterium]
MGGIPLWLTVVLTLLVVAALLLGLWCTWTAGRLDRMHLRLEAARASLEAMLQHRASVAGELASGGLTDPASALVLLEAARASRESAGRDDERWLAESELTAALFAVDLPPPDEEPLMGELVDAARKAGMARRIYNDVAANTRRLHSRRRVRWLHLAGHAEVPDMIDFDDRPDFGRTA